MIRADFVPPQLGTPEKAVSMLCIHGASYTYERRRLRLTIMGDTKKLAVGLAKTLPCPMLLGTNWSYLREVVERTMCNLVKEKGEQLYGKSLMGTKARLPREAEPEEEKINLNKVIGDAQFKKFQQDEPLFSNILRERLQRQETNPEQSSRAPGTYPWFEIRRELLYRVWKGVDEENTSNC